MANQEHPTSGNQTQSKKDDSQPRQQQGGDRSQSQSNDRSQNPNRKGVKPGDSDNEANQHEDEDKSVGPDEAEREGRNPKPFTVS